MGYSIVWEKSGTCIAYDGTVTYGDFMGAVLTIHESPEYARFRYVIHDMYAANELDFSQVDMTQIVAQELGARFTNPKIKVSIVTSDSGLQAMVNQFVAMTKLDVRIYSDLSQAREWSDSFDLM